jgi:hypothetical protein
MIITTTTAPPKSIYLSTSLYLPPVDPTSVFERLDLTIVKVFSLRKTHCVLTAEFSSLERLYLRLQTSNPSGSKPHRASLGPNGPSKCVRTAGFGHCQAIQPPEDNSENSSLQLGKIATAEGCISGYSALIQVVPGSNPLYFLFSTSLSTRITHCKRV